MSRNGTHPTDRPRRAFTIRRSKIAGKGGFATRRLQPGQFIIEYTGKRLTEKQADRLLEDDRRKRVHHTFLFQVSDGTVIDGGVRGGPAKFINHSCEPNCEAIEEDGRIFIHAKKNIQPGVELAYDYSYAREPGDGKKEEAIYPCRCGSRRCRGTILERKKRRRKRARRGRAR